MASQHTVPDASYTVATGEREGWPAVAMLNLAYSDFERCSDYPWLLSITIALEDQSDVGMPTDEEADVLNHAEDAIEAALRTVTPFHHIARQSWNGTRVLDYYVQFGERAQACVQTLSRSNAVPRTLTASVESDPEWSSWLPMLQSFV